MCSTCQCRFHVTLRCRERKEIYITNTHLILSPPPSAVIWVAKYCGRPPLLAGGLLLLIGWHSTKISPLRSSSSDGRCCSASIPFPVFSLFFIPSDDHTPNPYPTGMQHFGNQASPHQKPVSQCKSFFSIGRSYTKPQPPGMHLGSISFFMLL